MKWMVNSLHVFRKTNETADMLATEGREKKGDLWNICSLSLFCYNAYLLDCMDIGTLVY